jgi:hypothetical protein
MLGAISARLGREKVSSQFAPAVDPAGHDPGSFSGRLGAIASERRLTLLLCLAHGERTVSGLADLCRFDAAIAAEDLELLRRHDLAHRSGDGTWRLCCPDLAPGVERLVDLVLTQRTHKEGA